MGAGTDEHRQVVCLGDPTTAANVALIDATFGVDVDVTRIAALAAGTNNIGKVNVLGDQPTATTGAITTASTSVPASVVGYGNATITISGTHAGINAIFEASDDGGTTYYPIQVQREADGAIVGTTGVLASNSATMYTTSAPGFTHVRVRSTAFTSGSGAVRVSPGSMPFEPVVSALVQGQPAATPSVTNTAASATNVTLKAANSLRKALYIFNAGTSNLFVKLGATATATTSFTTMIAPNGFWELPDDPIYTGIVDGIWTATGGSGANVTELT